MAVRGLVPYSRLDAHFPVILEQPATELGHPHGDYGRHRATVIRYGRHQSPMPIRLRRADFSWSMRLQDGAWVTRCGWRSRTRCWTGESPDRAVARHCVVALGLPGYRWHSGARGGRTGRRSSRPRRDLGCSRRSGAGGWHLAGRLLAPGPSAQGRALGPQLATAPALAGRPAPSTGEGADGRDQDAALTGHRERRLGDSGGRGHGQPIHRGRRAGLRTRVGRVVVGRETVAARPCRADGTARCGDHARPVSRIQPQLDDQEQRHTRRAGCPNPPSCANTSTASPLTVWPGFRWSQCRKRRHNSVTNARTGSEGYSCRVTVIRRPHPQCRSARGCFSPSC